MSTNDYLPFGGHARSVDSVQPEGEITNASGSRVHTLPWAEGEKGSDLSSVQLNWSQPVKGRVRYQVRMYQSEY